MKAQGDLFFEAPCLTPQAISLSGSSLHSKWFKNSDKRYMESTLQKFIEINKGTFSFLDIRAEIVGTGSGLKLVFSTGSYTGAIPLRSPVNGKQIGDIAIHPRFVSGEKKYDEYISILTLLETEVLPEYLDSLFLASSSQLRPPLYFHASEYIRALAIALKLPWRKFRTITQFKQEPKGVIDWSNKYENSYDPNKDLLFNCKYSELSFNHTQIQQLKYVYDLSLTEINSSQAPLKLKYELLPYIKTFSHRLEQVLPMPCDQINIHASDPKLIKGAKNAANDFLNSSRISSKGWRIDFSLVFERFIQYLFGETSRVNGLKFIPNYKLIRTSTDNPKWSLKYLEPDGLLIGESVSAVIDAKYKAHMLSFRGDSKILADEHRLDLHQILAYSSFLTTEKRLLFLCYPSSELSNKKLIYKNPSNGKAISVLLLGIPLKTSALSKARQLINSIIAEA